MGLPLEDCPRTDRPYLSFTTSTSSTTTPQPTLEYYQLPSSGSRCPVDPCICGSLFLPKGLKYGNNGSTIKVGSNTYSLSHPLDGFIEKEQALITTSTKLVSDNSLQTDYVTINIGRIVNLVGVIRIIVKIRETQKIIGQVITGSFNESVPVSAFRVNLIDTFNLTNLTLQLEISSLCKNSKEVCCDRLPSSLTFNNIITSITCSTTTSTTTTTTTTLPPFCSQFNLPDSFYVTVVGYEALDGQQQISLVTRSGQTWSTSGSFPCGASYVLSMTCDSANSRFTYSGSINCCEEATKTIISPTSSPLLYPNAITPKIIIYTDCYCANCTTTTTTTTTTTDFPTTPPPPPPVPCKETKSLIINGYAFYRTQIVNVDIPGIGLLRAKCAGGHVCNRTDFLPQLITPTKTIDAQPISLNNISAVDKNVSATFSFSIADTSILKGGASVSLKCLSPNGCHNGVTWIILTAEKDGQTSVLFNSCVLPNSIDKLDFECENCCDWNGETFIKLSTECDNLQEDVKLLKLSNYLWELDTTLSCGDKINALVKCKPEVDYTDIDSCKNKWEVISFSFPCATNARVTGNLLEPCDCNKAPIFEFTADDFNNCECCRTKLLGYTHYTMGNAPNGYEWTFVSTEEDLYACKVLITGNMNNCGGYSLNPVLSSSLSAWVQSGGIFVYQEEWGNGCGNSYLANLAMSQAGSTIISQGGTFGNTGNTGGYIAISSNSPCVQGLTFHGALTASITGGTALLTAPAGENPGAVTMMGQMVGKGCVIMLGDVNLINYRPISETSWTEFLRRLLTLKTSELL